MRTYLWSVALVVLSAATVNAQLVPNQPRADGGKPAGAKPAGGDAGKREAGGGASNAMFTAIDVDGDGAISKIELKKAVAALKTLDADGDGSITMVEASVVATAPGNGAWGASNPMVDQMLQYDRNGDGKLTEDEVPAAMVQALQPADKNKDGALDRNELAAAARSMNNFQTPQNGFGGPRAGGGGAGNPAGKLMQYDRNGDGELSLQEIPQQMQGMFQAADDLNNDGSLDAGELQAVIARMGGRAKGINPGGNGRPGRSFEDNARKREAKLNQ